MYLKRRKLLFEDSLMPSLSPEIEEVKKSVSPQFEYSVRTERLAEQLRTETTPEKLEFFFQLGIAPITLVKKEGKDILFYFVYLYNCLIICVRIRSRKSKWRQRIKMAAEHCAIERKTLRSVANPYVFR